MIKKIPFPVKPIGQLIFFLYNVIIPRGGRIYFILLRMYGLIFALGKDMISLGVLARVEKNYMLFDVFRLVVC